MSLLPGMGIGMPAAVQGASNASSGTGGGILGGIGSFLGGPLVGSVLSGLGGLFQGGANERALNQGRSDIMNLPGMQGPISFGTGMGSAGANGFSFNPMLQGQQAMLGQMGSGLLQGGLFGNQSLQNALGGLNLGGALGGLQSAFGQQIGNSAFGGLGGQYGQVGNIANMLQGQAMAGPQDFTGGLQGGLLSQGFANQMAAGNQSGLQNQELAAMRAAAQPEQNRMLNSLESRLHARGMLGSTGGAEQMRGFFEAQNQQDMGFQQEAFNRAMQQQGFLGSLGSQQISQGGGFLGQNLGQYNQTLGNLQGFQQLGAGLEGQQFGQGLAGLQQNQNAALQNLMAQQGLLGFGGDLFAQQYGLGLGSQEALLGYGNLGLQAGRSPWELQAGLLSGGGQHAQALGEIASQSRGGFLGGLFSDARLKNNLRIIDTKADGLNVYQWDWADKAFEIGAARQRNWGFIAQEVELLYPELVSEDEATGYLTIDYKGLQEKQNGN